MGASKKEIDPLNWVALYADYLFATASMQVNDKEQAKDLVGDTFLSALQNIENFRGESSVKTWLTRILNNKIIDYYRKTSAQSKNLNQYLETTDEAFYQTFFESTKLSDYHWKSDTLPTKNEQFSDFLVTNDEFQFALNFCLNLLSPRLKPIFIAKFIHDESPENICKEFGISSSNYWTLIHRSKLLMRACLENKWLNG